MNLEDILEGWNGCTGSGGGVGCKTATLTVTCTNPDVSEVSIYYGVNVGGFTYMLNGEAPLLIEGGSVDLFVGDKNSASFIGIYNDSVVDLNLVSVTGDGEIKEDEDEVKWLEVHGDCTVTLSYTP